MKKLLGKLADKIKTVARKFLSVRFVVKFAAVVVLITGLAFGYHIYNKPDRVAARVFWGAVDDSLQTSSFSRHSITKNAGQSTEQTTDVSLSPKQGTYTQTHYVQTGVDEADAVTENIGTPYSDYVRYTSIATSQKNADGKLYDFSKIVGVWGGSAGVKTATNGQQFGQSVLASIPNGNLTASQRRDLIKFMKDKKVYTFHYTKPTRTGLLRRPMYNFTVTLKPSAYVQALKQFGDDMGLTQLKDLNPKDYEAANNSTFQVSIDGWSHEVVALAQAGGQAEEISGHDARKSAPAAPGNIISVDELQTRLQSVN